jgi:hypothetical protein
MFNSPSATLTEIHVSPDGSELAKTRKSMRCADVPDTSPPASRDKPIDPPDTCDKSNDWKRTSNKYLLPLGASFWQIYLH